MADEQQDKEKKSILADFLTMRDRPKEAPLPPITVRSEGGVTYYAPRAPPPDEAESRVLPHLITAPPLPAAPRAQRSPVVEAGPPPSGPPKQAAVQPPPVRRSRPLADRFRAMRESADLGTSPPQTETATQAAPAVQPEQEAVAPGPPRPIEPAGDLCPACGTTLGERNAMLECTSCGKRSCRRCGRYEMGHTTSTTYYDYHFDLPLCLTCYEKAFAIQKQLAKATTCLGNGNLTYAFYYASNALKIDPRSRYAAKAQEILDRVQKARESEKKHEAQWREQKKVFAGLRGWQPPP